MGKNGRYAKRAAAVPGGLVRNLDGGGRVDEAADRKYVRLSEQELSALANLVMGRVNMLAGQALISNETAARRDWWKRLCQKLEAMR